MADLSGFSQVITRLTELATGAKREECSVSVGFTQGYALYVHEDLTKHHPTGQAKFLEQPARELSSDGTLGRIVAQAKQHGATLAEGLTLAGLRLQRESQKLCPVDTGALRASAFTRLDEGE